MDEAPRDGTEIDVWIGGEFPGRLTDVSWREPTDSEWWVHGGDTIGTLDAAWHDGFGPLGSGRQPTHWRPLPPHPTSEDRSEEHTSELQSLMRISYAVFCLKKKKTPNKNMV